MNRLKNYFFVLGFLLLITGCTEEEQPGYEYQIPEKTDDGWEVGEADKVGMRTDPLADMMKRINDVSGHNIHSITIIMEGKLVFEEYFEGYLYSTDPPGSNGDYILYDRETDHYLASVSKSITSVIFGAAVKAGYIESVDTKLIDIMPEYNEILSGDKAGITLEHLLTMSSGLSWDEYSTSYTDPANDVVALFLADDPIEYILTRDMYNTPGIEFIYNSGGTNVLGAVIEKHTGMSLLDFANEYLFDPLNIKGGMWQKMAGDYFFASGGLYLRPRELAKIGFLFLRGGYWGSQQLITADWIDQSIIEHIETQGRSLWKAHSYGYQWWMADFIANGQVYESFLAAGWGDQYMMMIPEIDMMIVFNAGNYFNSGSLSPFDLVEDYILPAVRAN